MNNVSSFRNLSCCPWLKTHFEEGSVGIGFARYVYVVLTEGISVSTPAATIVSTGLTQMEDPHFVLIVLSDEQPGGCGSSGL